MNTFQRLPSPNNEKKKTVCTLPKSILESTKRKKHRHFLVALFSLLLFFYTRILNAWLRKRFKNIFCLLEYVKKFSPELPTCLSSEWFGKTFVTLKWGKKNQLKKVPKKSRPTLFMYKLIYKVSSTLNLCTTKNFHSTYNLETNEKNKLLSSDSLPYLQLLFLHREKISVTLFLELFHLLVHIRVS